MGIPQPTSDASTSGSTTADINTTTTTTTTSPDSLPPAALDLAAKLFDLARTGTTETLTQYLSAGIPPNLTNHSGDTLLMLASYHGHAPTVSALLAHGADVNCVNGKGQSPLAGAVFKGYEDVVQVLVEGGADVEAGQPSAVECAGMFKREGCARMMGVELGAGGGAGGVDGARDAVMKRLAEGYGRRADDVTE